MQTIIIGAQSDLGIHINGSALGSKQLINDIKAFYKNEIIEVSQPDDIMKSHNLSDRRKNEPELEKFSSDLYKVITEKTINLFPIVIGGDASISIASTMADVKKNLGNLGIVYISGHANYDTFQTTGNGNIIDLTLAAINGYKIQDLTYYHNGNKVLPSRTAIVGVRDISESQEDNIKYSGPTIFSCEDLKDRGPKRVLDDAFAIATNKTEGAHIVISLDIFDPTIAPGVSAPSFDGLNEEEANELILELLKRMEDITAIDIVDFNPLRDENRKTEQLIINYIAQIINAAKKKGIKDSRKY